MMRALCLYRLLPLLFLFTLVFRACEDGFGKTKAIISSYEKFRDSVLAENKNNAPDSSYIFDDGTCFTPGVNSVTALLIDIDSMLYMQASIMDKIDTLISRLKKAESYSMEEKEMQKENIRMLDSFLVSAKLKKSLSVWERNVTVCRNY